MCFRI